MSLYSIKHSKLAYRIDFALYGVVILTMAVFLLLTGSEERWLKFVALAVAGLASWTLIEYILHRFVMHGLRPFKQWHAQHHQQPTAIIYTPTIVSMGLFATLIFLPAQILLNNVQSSCALTLGVVLGYLFYSMVHHATHHSSRLAPQHHSAWLKRRKRWHAMHHQNIEKASCFGVTNGFWDYAFGSCRRQKRYLNGS